MAYYEKTTEHIKEDANGNITKDTTTESKSIKKNEEPDYIKIYTKMWCQFNNIPEKYYQLFLSLACRMTYAELGSTTGGQIVHTVGHSGADIMKECGWKNKDSLYKGLQKLCDCQAIIKLGRGEYQINPQYAGKGPWMYDKNRQQGGIADLVAKFSFKDKRVDTSIVWASTDSDEIGDSDGVIATRTKITPISSGEEAASAAPTDVEPAKDVKPAKRGRKKTKEVAS